LWKEQREDIDTALYDAVRKGLDHFGPTFKNVVFHELMNAHNLDGKSIGQNPAVFSEFLDRVFSVGAGKIRQAIVFEIGERFSVRTERDENMVQLIQRIRKTSKNAARVN
jgi:hypothetical protein